MADTTNPYESIENDPFRRKQNAAETSGNAYAYDINEGSPVPPFAGEDPFAAMRAAQENQYGDNPGAMTEINTPKPESGETDVEQTSGFGGSLMARELNQQVDMTGGVDIEGAISHLQGQYTLDGMLADKDGSIEAGAQSADSMETRSKNATEGHEDGDKINHADVGMKKVGSAAFRLSQAYVFIQKAMQSNDSESLARAQQELSGASSLVDDAESHARRTNNAKASQLILESATQCRALITEYQASINKLEDATKKAPEQQPVGAVTVAPESPFGAALTPNPAEQAPQMNPDLTATGPADLASAVEAYSAATNQKAVTQEAQKNEPIDYSEVYKQIVDTSVPIVNPGAKAAERAENAKKYSKSESFQRTATTEMNPGWGLASGPSPEKMPTASTAQLTPEQRAALQQKTGESQLPKAV